MFFGFVSFWLLVSFKRLAFMKILQVITSLYIGGAEKMAANARPLIVSRYEQRMVWNALLAEYKSII